MRIPRPPHNWRITVRQAIRVQNRLAAMVSVAAAHGRFRFVAGLDVAFLAGGRECLGGVVVWDLTERIVVEERTATVAVTFPYVPGFLSFREAPVLIKTLRKLRVPPDAIMCDGQGLAHPRRFGLACHMGVLTGLPAVGCGKSRLVGAHGEPGPGRGHGTGLFLDGERVGTVLRTRDGVRPVYVSVGSGMSLGQAERLVLDSCEGYRIPEPTRRADQLVAAEKRRFGR